MSREIKFRGLDKVRNEWVYGSYIEAKDGGYIVDAPIQQGIPTQMIEVDSETVGQNTGLKDKNGKEVWEGDILEYSEWRVFLYKVLKEVVWEKHGFGFRILGIPNPPTDCTDLVLEQKKIEVIGNIYQNPELLNGV